MIKYFFVLISFFCGLMSKQRHSSFPYISGDTFRNSCDHIFDETKLNLEPLNIKQGDTIFVMTALLEEFFLKYHPLIKKKYILVTHNKDLSVTYKFYKFLSDKKLFVWFAENANFYHKKFIPIPIGIENNHWNRKYEEEISHLKRCELGKKKYFLYANFRLHTHSFRREIYNFFKNKKFCFFASNRTVGEYLKDVYFSKFILSPSGNGLDCHRTWEALYLGAIPIIKSSCMDDIYRDLPVFIVNNWESVTGSVLSEKHVEMCQGKYNLQKLYFSYWDKLIQKYKYKCRELER